MIPDDFPDLEKRFGDAESKVKHLVLPTNICSLCCHLVICLGQCSGYIMINSCLGTHDCQSC